MDTISELLKAELEQYSDLSKYLVNIMRLYQSSGGCLTTSLASGIRVVDLPWTVLLCVRLAHSCCRRLLFLRIILYIFFLIIPSFQFSFLQFS